MRNILLSLQSNAVIAQLVEHQLPKLRVASSSLVYRSSISPAAAAAGFIF